MQSDWTKHRLWTLGIPQHRPKLTATSPFFPGRQRHQLLEWPQRAASSLLSQACQPPQRRLSAGAFGVERCQQVLPRGTRRHFPNLLYRTHAKVHSQQAGVHARRQTGRKNARTHTNTHARTRTHRERDNSILCLVNHRRVIVDRSTVELALERVVLCHSNAPSVRKLANSL